MSSEKRTADTVVYHRNHFLFSNDYLNRVLPASPQWAELLSRSETTAEKLRTLYDSLHNDLAHLDADTLSIQWVRPLLEHLGHTLLSGTELNALLPDLSPPDLALISANVEGGDLSPGDIDALVRVLPWDAPLDSLSAGQDLNPMAQLEIDLQRCAIDWGLLSNGRVLRLVSRQNSANMDRYFELDLPSVLESQKHEALAYLSAFFGTPAFEQVKKKKTFLETALLASVEAEKAQMQALQENLYQTLEVLIQGYLDFPGNQLPHTDLQPVYENSLYLLYRLIFVLFAESRAWLPLEDPRYYDDYSLEKLRREIATSKNSPPVRSTHYWEHLQRLFDLLGGKKLEINDGLGIAALDNDLYNEERHPFLGEKKIGDAPLATAIDLLSCWKVRGRRKSFFDYGGFRPQQVAEQLAKLLDYKAYLAAETLARVDENTHQRWLPAKDLSEDAAVLEQRDQGRVYLQDKTGHTKTSQQTPLPAGLAAYMAAESIRLRLDANKARALEAIKAEAVDQNRAELAGSFVDEVLSLRLVDPACGSGQILCSALDNLAAILCSVPAAQPPDGGSSEIQCWKKTILKNCIYGVDKNPLAVELTRLCLWLSCGLDTLPCILEHHIRSGNALIGARVQDLGWAPPQILKKDVPGDLQHRSAGQLNAFGFLLNQSLPRAIGEAVASVLTVQKGTQARETCQKAFQEAEQKLYPLRLLGDLWMSVNFGNVIRPGNYDEALQYITQPEKLASLPAVRRAIKTASQQRFFHWELAFPEVYFDTSGQPRNASGGFDIILGYPSHGSAERQTENYEIHHEPFVFFWKSAISNAHQGSTISFLTPDTWLNSKRHAALRRSLLKSGELLKIITLPGSILNYPDGECCLVWLRRGNPGSEPVLAGKVASLDKLLQLKIADLTAMDISQWQKDPYLRFTLDPALVRLQGLVRAKQCIQLGSISDMAWGLKPYSRGAQLEKDFSADMIRIFEPPAPEERHIYYPELIEDKLTRFAAYPNRRSWIKYTGMYTGAVREDFFTRPRLMLNREFSPTGSLMAAATSERMITSENILNILITQDGYAENYLAALLNSKLLSWIYHNQSEQELGAERGKVNQDVLKKLPIMRTDANTQPFERSRLGSQMRREVEQQMEGIHSVKDMIGLDVRFTKLLELVEANLPNGKEIIHDLLSTLAESISEQIERRSGISRNFWRDLAGAAGAELYKTLKDKEAREDSLAAHTACQPFVNANSVRGRTLDASLGWNEEAYLAFVISLAGSQPNLSELVGPYRIHAPAYRHRNVLVAAHDWLIDRIVYRLYGLGEDEMAIVDGLWVR